MNIGNARSNGALLVAAYVRATNGKIPTRQWLTDVAKATLHYQESLLGQRGSEEPETAPEGDDFEQLGVLEGAGRTALPILGHPDRRLTQRTWKVSYSGR